MLHVLINTIVNTVKVYFSLLKTGSFGICKRNNADFDILIYPFWVYNGGKIEQIQTKNIFFRSFFAFGQNQGSKFNKQTSYIVVLLPAPLWPSSAVIWPSKKFSVKLFTTVLSLNFRERPFMEMPAAKCVGSCSIYLSLEAFICKNYYF